MRAIVLSLAICAASAVSVGFIIADAISVPTHAPAPAAEANGWATTVYKNPH
jgi:hypothetical protein